jgi:hypothetical protein
MFVLVAAQFEQQQLPSHLPALHLTRSVLWLTGDIPGGDNSCVLSLFNSVEVKED